MEIQTTTEADIIDLIILDESAQGDDLNDLSYILSDDDESILDI
jgi:hypothetical protein